MLAFGWLVGTVVLGASAATAALLLWIVSRMAPAPEEPRLQEAREGAERCVMLFDGPRLFDATPPRARDARRHRGERRPPTRASCAICRRASVIWAARSRTSRRWAGVEFRSGGSRLAARWCDGLTRIEVIEAPASDARSLPAPGARSAARGPISARSRRSCGCCAPRSRPRPGRSGTSGPTASWTGPTRPMSSARHRRAPPAPPAGRRPRCSRGARPRADAGPAHPAWPAR